MDALQILVGSTIKIVEIVHDYLQLTLTNDMILNIYNNYDYSGKSILALKGKKILSVKAIDLSIVFSFQKGKELIVSLMDDDYNGPEAIEIISKHGSPIVW